MVSDCRLYQVSVHTNILMVFLLVVKLPIDLMPSNVYDVAIRQGKAKDKPYKIGNGGGLYLLRL